MCGATIPETVTRPRAMGAASARPLFVALAVTALITAMRMTGTVDSDVAWQLWIANRIHAGANLYRDIIETNPPLWFWMALPFDWVANFLGVRLEPVAVAAMGLLVALSLAATERLIRHIDASRRTLFLGYAALALAAMPWAHVGQREQIVLIGALPYVALIAARRESRAVSAPLALMIGAGAALGFALKQYFLIVPAALELWLLVTQRSKWRPLRPEILAMVTVGAAYAAAVVLLESDFLTTVVPLLRLAYGVFGAPSLRFMLGPFAIVGLAILAFVAAHGRLSAKAPLAQGLLIVSLAFTAVYFIQFKGWPYHAIPMIGAGSLALAALLTEAESPPSPLRVAGPPLLALPLLLSAQEQLHPTLPSPDLRTATAGLRPGDTVGFLTTETAVPWSVTLQGRYRYASRYNGFWMMRAIVGNELRGNPDSRLNRLGRQIVAETVADFACTPPARIIVSRPGPGDPSFDILPFFERDPRFRDLLSHYKVRSRTSLETYELASPFRAQEEGCRHGI